MWCGPCKQIAPTVEALADDYAGRLKVAKMDVDHHQVVPQQYRVTSIPTLLLFKGGKVVAQLVGAHAAPQARGRDPEAPGSSQGLKAALAALLVAACQSGTSSSPGGGTAPVDPSAPAGCDAVAEAVATVVLGNYAGADKRDHVVRRERQACAAAALPDGALACVASATTREEIAACAPALAIDVDCADVVARVRAAARRPANMDAALAAQVERGLQVMQVACEDDDWPIAIEQCIVAAKSLEPCAAQIPKDLKDKLAKRVVDELR